MYDSIHIERSITMKEEMKCPFHHGENMEVHVGSNVDAKDPVRS